MKWLLLILGCLVCAPLGWAAPAFADDAAVAETVTDTPLASAADESRAQNLFKQLRCVVCEGQSLADSNALLAADMRALVRKRIAMGYSDADILSFFARQYGQEILMKPPLTPQTALLWLAPILIVVFGLARLQRYFHSSNPES